MTPARATPPPVPSATTAFPRRSSSPPHLLCAGSDSVAEALAFVTACLVDPNCVLERSTTAAADEPITGDDGHSGHGDGDGKFVGLKIGLAAAFLAMTIITSYLPLVFMFSRHYTVRHHA